MEHSTGGRGSVHPQSPGQSRPARATHRWRLLETSALLAMAASLVLLSQYHYLLFHSLIEGFCVIVAASVFITYRRLHPATRTGAFTVLAHAYLAVAALDFLHALSYKGINVFAGYDANLPTQLWVTGRGLEAGSLVLAALLFRRRINPTITMLSYAALLAALLLLIFNGLLPSCYEEGTGLTWCKRIAEYVIIATLGGALLLYSRLEGREAGVVRYLSVAIITTMLAELMFTFYVSVYGLSNVVGHALKFISYYCIYRGVVEQGSVLFSAASDTNRDPGQRLIPVCSACKDIRTDDEHWIRMESYLHQEAGLQFTHGICPKCIERLYPDDGS